MMSVSIRSPTITVVSECASSRLRAERIMSGFGLPMKYGARPVAVLISAATEPVAGSEPAGDGAGGGGRAGRRRAGHVRVGGDEARAGLDQPDRPRDCLERVGPRLAEH